MTCVSDSCVQGREPCPTPYACGLIKVTEKPGLYAPLRDQPPVTTEDAYDWLVDALACAVAVLAIVCAFLPSIFF